MNASQKKKMYDHYRKLGWSDGQIATYGTIDFTGKLPVEKKEKKEKKSKK